MSAQKELEKRLGVDDKPKSINADEVLTEKDVAGNDLYEGDKVWYANGSRDDTLREGTIIRYQAKTRDWDSATSRYADTFTYRDYLCIKGVYGHRKSISSNCVKKIV